MSSYIPNKPDDECMKSLIRARNFLEHARLHSTLDNEFDLMISLHHLDNSIEYLLRIIIRHLDIENITKVRLVDADLGTLIKNIDSFAKDLGTPYLPYVSQIKDIRVLRNQVQHGCVLPISDNTTQMVIGYNFFERCLNNYFGLKIDEIKSSTLIANEKIRQLLINVEKYVDENSYLEAVVYSRNAFEYAKLIYLKSSSLKFEHIPALLEVGNSFPSLISYIMKLNDRVELDSYKVDINSYERFKEYSDHIPKEYRVDIGANMVMQRDWEKNDALFCYHFVIDLVFRWQTMQMKKLYEPKMLNGIDNFKQIKHVYEIGGVELKQLFEEYSCIYSYGNQTGMLFYTDGPTKDNIKNHIFTGKEYDYLWKTVISDNLINTEKCKVEINYIDTKVALHDYPAWQITLWYTTSKAS